MCEYINMISYSFITANIMSELYEHVNCGFGRA